MTEIFLPTQKRFSFKKFLLICLTVAVLLGMGWGAWRVISAETVPVEITINLPEGLTRSTIAQIFGDRLRWTDEEKREFSTTLAQMQWAEWNSIIAPIFSNKFSWNYEAQEEFLTHSTYYLNPAYDFLSPVYEPGSYTVKRENSIPEIANLLIEKTNDVGGSTLKDHLAQKFGTEEMAAVAEFVRQELELLPDLVPLPAQDVRIDRVGENVLLSFSTIYYNQGRGALELRGDPKTAGIRSDIERDVLQRIYLKNGGYRDKRSGTFLWHQPHLHYHFADFIIYDLEVVEVDGVAPDLSGVRSKSTFCIRDISRVSLGDLPNQEPDAVYQICKKELQGISVGWGDTYFFNYPDQNLNITDLPSGRYKLSFIVNPEKRFDEITQDNNVSSVVIDIDMEKLTVDVIDSFPKEIPEFEHVYPKQQNCNNCTL